MPTTPTLMSEKQAADYLSVPRSTLTRLRLAGKIRFYKLTGRTIRYSQDMIEEFLIKQENRIA